MRPTLFLLALAIGCGPGESSSDTLDTGEPWDRGENPHPLDDLLRFHHIQTKGTHNSYHLEPATPLDDSHRYSQPTLTEQLSLYGVRQLELDVHRTNDDVWHVLHLPGIDADTTCLLLEDCLGEIKAWSDANGWHVPITIWVEPKDEIDDPNPDYKPIDEALLTLDDAFRAVFPEPRLFTPDDLRGSHATLPEALAAEGWPTLGQMRGQVLFALLDTGEDRDRYLEGTPSLEGRAMFVDTSDETDAFAALVKDGSPDSITRWAEAGFVITDNGSGAADDEATAEADDLANLAAGVHHNATDLTADPGDGSYWFELQPRCNPVTAPTECTDDAIESL